MHKGEEPVEKRESSDDSDRAQVRGHLFLWNKWEGSEEVILILIANS